mgnify:CR=1 FL=1
MVFMGLGYSLTNPSTARGVLVWFPVKRRGLAMGLKQVGVPLGGVLAAVNGGLAAFIHWQLLMYGVAVLIAINGVFCMSLFRYENHVVRKGRPSSFSTIGEVLRDKNFSIYTLLCGLLNIGQTNFFGFLSLFLTDVVRASVLLAVFWLKNERAKKNPAIFVVPNGHGVPKRSTGQTNLRPRRGGGVRTSFYPCPGKGC